MLTRCPACRTRFRLHPAQLRVADGQVRCGKCGHRFNAQPQQHFPFSPRNQRETVTSTVIHPIPPQGPGPVGRALWSLGILLLLVALAGQFLWWERHALAAHPLGQQALRQICRHVPCDVQPPREPDKIVVLERGLSPHPREAGALLFKLRLENRADHAQPHPVIELRLFDAGQTLVGARRFAPTDYRNNRAGNWDLMAPRQTVNVELALQDPGTHVTGFLLDFL